MVYFVGKRGADGFVTYSSKDVWLVTQQACVGVWTAKH